MDPTVRVFRQWHELCLTVTNPNDISQSPEWTCFGSGSNDLQGGGWNESPPSGGYGSLTSSTTTMSVAYVRTYQLRPMAWNLGAGGSGTWNSTNTNWSFTDGTTGTTFANGDNLFFNGSNGTVTIASGFTPSVGSLQFDSGNFTVTGGSLTLANNIVNVAGPDRDDQFLDWRLFWPQSDR